MNKRPRTPEDMAALPIGPEFGQDERVIDGRTVRVPVMRALAASWANEDAPVGYRDADGLWVLGQYADGQWFRRRAGA